MMIGRGSKSTAGRNWRNAFLTGACAAESEVGIDPASDLARLARGA